MQNITPSGTTARVSLVKPSSWAGYLSELEREHNPYGALSEYIHDLYGGGRFGEIIDRRLSANDLHALRILIMDKSGI